MRLYIADFNGVLTDLKEKYKAHLVSPRDADAWILWQDVRGSYSDLIKASKAYYPKPVYCVQHGRGATSDYAEPNKMPLLADKFLCWGSSDYDRMCNLGYKERTHIIGCPLNPAIAPKVLHKEKIVLFVPISTGKEEPENIAIYYELLKLRYHKAQIKILDNRVSLKDKWGFDDKRGVSFREINTTFDVIAKLLPWHERSLYHGNVVTGFQDSPTNNQLVFNLLRNVDLVVGLDEGTTEIFAYAHDIPVVICDGFKYRQYNEDAKNYTLIEGYKTKAATHCSLRDLAETINQELEHPERLKKERLEVAEAEMGLSYTNPTENIMRIIKRDIKKA